MRRIEKKLAGLLSGLSVDYSFTERSRRDRTKGLGKTTLQAGTRVPDAILWGAQQPGVRLYELLRNRGGYCLLIFATATALATDRPHLARLLQIIAERYGDLASPFVVIDEGVPEVIGLTTPVFIDVKGEFQRKFGAMHGSVILTRPDGFVAFHLRGLNVEFVLAALELWLRSRSIAGPELVQASIRDGQLRVTTEQKQASV